MNYIFQDETKIKEYSQIQRKLCELNLESSDQEVENIINEIPKKFLENKEDLMILSQLIAFHGRNRPTKMKRFTIKMFELIMTSLKKLLNDESTFFWNILGNHLYFKLWFYEEGLISIDQIYRSSLKSGNSMIIEYFLPELKTVKPEIFEKEIKHHTNLPYSDEGLEKYRELRKKHFRWLRESGDFHHPLYEGIEKNRLLYSIKIDDVETFQKILSDTNMPINTKIQESAIENFLLMPHEMTLLELAVEFNSFNIIKFLLMNDVEVSGEICSFSIKNNNYEMIHYIEPKMKDAFPFNCLSNSVLFWKEEVTEYAFNNYNFSFLLEENAEIENNEFLLELINQTFSSLNFVFFESVLLPFLRRNGEYVKSNIHRIIIRTFSEQTCFFSKEFMKYPGIDVNHYFNNENITLLTRAIEATNDVAINILLNHPKIKINAPAFKSFSPFHLAIRFFVDEKVTELFCSHRDFQVNLADEMLSATPLKLACIWGNVYIVKYLTDNFANLEEGNDFPFLMYACFVNNHFLAFEIILKYFIKNHKELNKVQILNDISNSLVFLPSFNTDFLIVLTRILNEIFG